jgi:hypothetical protein
MASIEEVWRFGSYWDEEGTWALQEPPKYLGLSTSAIGKGNTGDVYVLPDLLLQRLYTGGPEDELPPGAFAGIVETKVMPIWERTARWSPKDVQQEVRPSDARNVYPTQQETLQVKASHQPRAVLSCPSKPIRELFTSDSGSTPEDYRYTFYLPEDVYDRPGCEVRVFLVGLCPGEVPCEPPASSVLEMERATAMDVTDGSIPKSKGTDTGADSSCTAEDAGAAASDADASCAPTKFP